MTFAVAGILGNVRFAVTVLAAMTAVYSFGAPLNVYVSPEGDDANAGTQAAPFRTLEKARDYLREITGRSAGPAALPSDWEGATINLLEGVYRLSETFILDERDSGSETAPVVYRAAGGTVRITGGRTVPRNAWRQVLLPLLENRIQPGVIASVYRLNLRDVGLKTLGDLGTAGDFIGLVVGGSLRLPARWPNNGWLRIAEVRDSDSIVVDSERVKTWENKGRRWARGYWHEGNTASWSEIGSVDQTASRLWFRKPLPEGPAEVNQWLQVFNVLEELDEPGEWWYDADLSQVLLLPERIEDLDSVEIAELATVASIHGAGWIEFEGIDFEVSGESTLTIFDCERVRLTEVNVRHAGTWGVVVAGGDGVMFNTVVVEDVGAGGIHISGGDQMTLSPAGHVIENTKVADFGKLYREGAAGIRIEGVGISVNACTVERGSCEAVFIAGNNHRLTNCIFQHLDFENGWTPVVRVESGWIGRGNEISGSRFEALAKDAFPDWLGNNEFANAAILLDRGSSGTVIGQNDFMGSASGIVVEGGRDNTLTGNTFTNVESPIFLGVLDLEEVTALQEDLDAVPYTSGDWLSRYPGLAGVGSGQPTAPVGTVIEQNRNLDRSVLVDASEDARDSVPLASQNFNVDGGSVELAQLLAYDSSGPDVIPLPASGLVFYVAPTGDDANAGTADAPFKTIAHARDALREATGRTSGASNLPGDWQGATVVIREGVYYQPSELVFDERDSGSVAYPIVYRAYPGEEVVVSGAYPVPDSMWQPLTEADGYAWNKVNPEYRGEIYVLDVSHLNVDPGDLGGGWSGAENMLMLIAGGEMRTMSRWPSGEENSAEGWVKLETWTDSGSGQVATVTLSDGTPRNWGLEKQDILAQGMWAKSWCVQWERLTALGSDGAGTSIQFNRQGSYPLGSGHNSVTPFLALWNQLNVIGPGQYSWNRTRGRIYYRARGGEGAPRASSLTNLRYLLRLGADGVSDRGPEHLQFVNLSFEGSRTRTVRAFFTRDIVFSDCEVRNSGGMGWEMKDVASVTISGGSTHHIAQKAGSFHGGDKALLRNADILIEDHSVFDIGIYLHGNSTSAIRLSDADYHDTCGITLRRVAFDRLRDQAIAVGGANITIEDCTFSNVCMITGDAGGITTASAYDFALTNVNVNIRNCSFSGFVRHPYHQPSHGALYAIYCDSQSNWTIADNDFENCDHAINIAGGKFHKVVRNRFRGAPGHHKAPVVFGNRIGYNAVASQLYSDLDKWPLNKAPWSEQYPDLIEFRRSGVRADLINHHQDITFLDNAAIDVDAIARIVSSAEYRESSGVMVGVDESQLQFPLGSEKTPTEGGGTVPLSEMKR